jgi:transposase
MFFRLKKTASGQVLKLIESYRDEAGYSRHRTVASLGNAPLAPPQWTEVAKAVEERLYGMGALVERELDEISRNWVDRIVRQVNSEGRWQRREPVGGQDGWVLDGVLGEEVAHTETALLGPVLLGWRTWERLGMPNLLEELGLNRSQCLAAAVNVINRLVDPVAEYSLLAWYQQTGLPELMRTRLRGCGDDRFYRVSDVLLERRRAIEAHLRARAGELFGLQRTVLLYDLTNSHFEGICAHNPQARRGHNKQKRHDCPQIVVGMVFDQEGFELGHEVFEGNQSDSGSLVKMLGRLEEIAGRKKEKPLVIMDAGVASRKNLQVLREHGFHYVVNDSRSRRAEYRAAFEEKEKFKVVPGRKGKPEVKVRLLAVESENGWRERVVLCWSAPRREKELVIRSNAEDKYVAELEKLEQRVAKGQLQDEEKIQRALGRLQARHRRVQRYYQVGMEQVGKQRQLCWHRNDAAWAEAEELCGGYILRTDDATLAAHELWRLYISLTRAEDGFRALKSDLGLRPNRHHKETRVAAHVFICVLAYHLMRHILYQLETQGDQRSWETIKRILETHSYATILMPTQDGILHRFRKAGVPEECQKSIYKSLAIEWRGLPSYRSIVPCVLSKHRRQATTL